MKWSHLIRYNDLEGYLKLIINFIEMSQKNIDIINNICLKNCISFKVLWSSKHLDVDCLQQKSLDQKINSLTINYALIIPVAFALEI